jgi:hypothetical protein
MTGTNTDQQISDLATAAKAKPLIVTNRGSVLLVDGVHEPLTDMVQCLLAEGKEGQKRENLRFMTRFLEFAAAHGSTALAFLRYDVENGVRLICEALKDIGLTVKKKRDLSDVFEVSQTAGFPNYRGRYTRIIRKIYAEAGERGLLAQEQSPAEVPGWHAMDADKRLRYGQATIGNPYGRKYAGARFVVKGRQKHAGRRHNPEGVGEQMTEAFLKSEAPPALKMVTRVLEVETPRINELLPSDALGWSKGGFGPMIFVSNKWDDAPYSKAVGLTSDAHEYLLREFGSQPHPHASGLSLLDHLRELANDGDEDALRQFLLFAKPDGGRYSYSGYRYWFEDAMLSEQVNVSGWAPTPHFYRNCRMHGEVSLMASTYAFRSLRCTGSPTLRDQRSNISGRSVFAGAPTLPSGNRCSTCRSTRRATAR